MLDPFPKDFSSFGQTTQLSEMADTKMETILLRLEEVQRQHQTTLLQVLQIVQNLQHGSLTSGVPWTANSVSKPLVSLEKVGPLWEGDIW